MTNSAGIRTAELAATLSLAADLAIGQPIGHGLRSCLLATRVAERLGLAAAERRSTYYVALLRWAGCTSDARLLAGWFGDDIRSRREAFLTDFASPTQMLGFMALHAGAGRSPLGRAGALASMIRAGSGLQAETASGSCEVSRLIADRLGLAATVQQALDFTFERWDGRGVPSSAARDEIPLPARIVQVTDIAEVLARNRAPQVREELGRRAGKALDPNIVEHVASAIADADPSGDEDAWSAVLAAEPGPGTTLRDAALDAAIAAIADFIDLKSQYTAGHSRAVAELADAAVVDLGAGVNATTNVRRAAWVHDLGIVGVSNGILDKPGPLSHAEWEQVRLHPYVTERILSRSAALASIGATASLHHERLDGSGYHRGSTGAMLPHEARVLAAAEAYRSMVEARAHRPARQPAEAASELRRAAKRGELDGPAAEAVLVAAGHEERHRRPWPFGLTEREVEVVRLIADGLTTREIATTLSISAKTADHHVQHIYGKLDVSSRPGVALIAMEHGLIGQRGSQR